MFIFRLLGLLSDQNQLYFQIPNRFLSIFFIILSFGLLSPTLLKANEPQWSSYESLLKHHLTQNTKDGITLSWLDYKSIKADPDYKKTVDELQNYNVDQLDNKKAKLAFYINAYNILAIKMVVDNWPVKSIKDIGSWFNPVWKKNVGKISGKTVTLHEIEHDILRKMGEPRIHMAIVCASLSCPDLRHEPYRTNMLEAQLEDQTQQFFNNKSKGLEISGDSIKTSKILDWFAEDFNDQMAFIRKYRNDIPSNSKIDGFLNYNWSLNGNTN
ncbi:MAG: DUF547 domain-containing protein [Magnetococcales bacterium]|nr:DUF547 domain-containing protein [Magnetococcales bacterium]